MGFLFNLIEAPPVEKKVSASVKMMHRLGCRICPLAKSTCRSPEMRPVGTREPVIYMLGGQPAKEDDEDGRPFTRDSKGGRMLDAYLPEDIAADLRFNNVVRTYADDEHKPTNSEIECCRPSVEKDIAETQPVAIFGFGNVALQWVRPGMRLADLRGRRFPVKIGGHVCWYYCFDDPAELRRPIPTKWGSWKVDPQREKTFKFDLQRAVSNLEYGDKAIVHSRADAMVGIEVITKRDGVQRVLDALEWAGRQEVIGYDYETSKLRPYRADAHILSLSVSGPGRHFSFGLHHRQAGWTPTELEKIDKAIRSLLRSPARKTVHNLAFELEWTGVKFGTEFIRMNTWEDSTSQAFVLDERTGNKQRNGPGSLHFGCRLHFDLPLKDLSPEIDANTKKNMAAVALDKLLPYNSLDGKYHREYYLAQDKLIQREGLERVYRMKVKHVQTVVLTQIKGARIDPDANKKYFDLFVSQVADAELRMRATKAYREFTRIANRFFNPDSDPDMLIMLRDILKTQHGRNDDGTYSAEKETLEKVHDPIIKPILELRRATKALSTYVLPLRPDSEHNYDGFCHTILNTTTARTGRLSSEAPNVQNFPVRDPEMGKVREQITASPGNLIMKVDYSQIEARVIAMVSKDPVFVKALWERYDVHMAWALKIETAIPRILKRWPLGDDYPTRDKQMKALRTSVKNEWTFPLFFGAQLRGVANFLQVEEHELLPLREEFWDTFKGVKAWQDTLRQEFQETGEINYITGRKARGPLSENQLFNYPIQGPTCDIIMDAMERVSARSAEDWNYQPIFQIHDDLTFDLPEKKIEDYSKNILIDMLSMPYDFINVPIQVEVAIGPNWHDVHSEGEFSTDGWLKDYVS